MSLVLFALTHDFIFVGGDKRGINIKREIVSENFNKVLKINNIIIGTSGKAQDSYLFLDKYCDFSRENGLTCKENNNAITFKNMILELNCRYKELLEIHLDKEKDIFFNFTVVVCGHNGKDFMAMQYSINEDNINKSNGIFPIEINPQTSTRCFVIGMDEYLPIHNTNYSNELKKVQPITILQYKNVMQNVFDMGIEFDDTINNFAVYERVKKKDVL